MPAWLAHLLVSAPGDGLSIRAAENDDFPILRALYAQSREMELAHTPWPAPVKQSFCDSQFDLQHRHYVSHYTPTAAFLVVLRGDSPIGRLYLHWSADELRVVDILIERISRGQGIGSRLLRQLQVVAQDAAFPTLSLHVEQRNHRACRLYRRLGFTESDRRAGYMKMDWHPGTEPLS